MACSCVIKDNFFSSVEKNEKQLKKMRKIDCYLLGFTCGSAIKNLPACRSCWRSEFSHWIGKIPWGENHNPIQYSCLQNPYGFSRVGTTEAMEHAHTHMKLYIRQTNIKKKARTSNLKKILIQWWNIADICAEQLIQNDEEICSILSHIVIYTASTNHLMASKVLAIANIW